METSFLGHQAERILPPQPSLLMDPLWRPQCSHSSLNCQIRRRCLSLRKITMLCPRSKILLSTICQHRGMQVVIARFCVSAEPISAALICPWSLRHSLRSGEPDQIQQSRGSANRTEVHQNTKFQRSCQEDHLLQQVRRLEHLLIREAGSLPELRTLKSTRVRKESHGDLVERMMYLMMIQTFRKRPTSPLLE